MNKRAEQALSAVWISHVEVLEHLSCSREYIRSVMRATPDTMERPWHRRGLGSRAPIWWDARLVDAWWKEVHEWLGSRSAATSTTSGGASSTEREDRTHARTTGRRSASSSTSSGRPSKRGETGSLLTVAELLTLRGR